MKTFISLLRGINVSGQNKIRMPELKGLYESLNLVNVVTYNQSGNVIFDCTEQVPATIVRFLEAEITGSFGLSVKVLLRDKEGFQEIIGSNPFVNQRNEDPERQYVTFLSEAPAELALRNLVFHAAGDSVGSNFKRESEAGDEDEYFVYDREIYLFCPNGYGRTKFSNTYFERKLGLAATTRNWKTVNALYEMANQR
jgi:uncharacterized protein (DUF1697 family)